MSLIMLIISFLIAGYALILVVPVCTANFISSHIIDISTEDIYLLDLWRYGSYLSDEEDELTDFLEGLSEIDGVAGVGGYYMSSFTGKDGSTSGNLLVVSSSLLELTGKKDVCGEEIQISCQDGIYPAVVGYDLQEEYPVGSLIEVNETDSTKRYVVTQVLEKNSRWFADDISGGYFIDLDAKIIINMDDIVEDNEIMLTNALSNICIISDGSSSGDEFVEEITDVANENSIKLYGLKTLKEKYGVNIEDLFSEKDTFIMPLVLIFLSVVAMVIASMINIHTRKRGLAALYASGYSLNNLSHMYFMEYLSLTVIAAAISTAYWSVNQYDLGDSKEMSYMIPVTLLLFFLAFIITIISSLAPHYKLKHTDISTLLS